MRDLVAGFLDHRLSRREFVAALSALGFSSSASAALAEAHAVMEAPGPQGASGTVATGTGGELVLAQARAAGIEYLFTNPGSFEVGLFDALVDDPQIHLIEGLHEGIVVSMADGYHKVSQRPALVNVHAIAGTAQMAGQLYNCARDGSAVVVTAGLNDNQAWSDEALLAPRPGFDQKDVNRQFTKISWDARESLSLPMMLRRALRVATTDPGGPVYLAMAGYALEAKGVTATILPAERFLFRARARPDPAMVERTARLLIEARRPVIIAGDEVWKSGGQPELVDLAESLGIGVTRLPDVQTFENFPTRHPLQLARGFEGDETGAEVDVLFFVGARDAGGRVVPRAPELPGTARIARLGMETGSLGRNYPSDVTLLGDVKSGLRDIRAAVDGLLTRERRTSIAAARRKPIETATASWHAGVTQAIAANLGRTPIHPDEVGKVLAENIDRNAIVVSENLTGSFDSFRFGFRDDEQTYLGAGGASLGWGLGAAAGAKLGAPDRQVICSIGDGSLMYSAAGFWTLARYHIPVLVVVWNNRNYQTVRLAYHRYRGKMLATGKYQGMYLGNPDIDFVKLAGSQGVGGERVVAGSELRPALRRGLAATAEGRPYLVEVVIARIGGGAESTWFERFDLAASRKRRV